MPLFEYLHVAYPDLFMRRPHYMRTFCFNAFDGTVTQIHKTYLQESFGERNYMANCGVNVQVCCI